MGSREGLLALRCKGCGQAFSWKCQHCGKRVKLNGSREDRPEIDHIVPISAGGAHVWDNVQLLCRDCNSRKSAKLQGQGRLFGNMSGLIPHRGTEMPVAPKQSADGQSDFSGCEMTKTGDRL